MAVSAVGRHDSALGADNVTALLGRALLVEFKAENTALRREREKVYRQGFFQNIGNSPFAESTLRAHWLAFYHAGKVLFSPYRNLVPRDFAKTVLANSLDMEDFLSALLKNEGIVGLPLPEFRAYVQQLQQWSGKNSGDVMPVMVLWYDQHTLRIQAAAGLHEILGAPSELATDAREERTRRMHDGLTGPKKEGGATPPRPPRL